MQTFNFLALDTQAGLRIDSFVAQQCPDITRSAVQQMLLRGEILCNGRVPAKSYQMCAGDAVVLSIPNPHAVAMNPQDIFVPIVYEDDLLLVVNKPKGMVVHPAPGNPDGTLVNAMLFHCHGNLSGINGELRPGIVHRIDKDTSGLLVIAKTSEAHLALSEQFAVHSITRVYRAVVYGRVKEDSGFVEEPIGRHPVDRKRMAITDKNSKYAYTSYEVVEAYRGFTQLALQLKTGRTHQIRVHMASIGHPLAGDAVYGPKKVLSKLNGQCLHAKTLGFVHPGTGEYMEFDSELPAYFTDFTNTLQKD
ncbi:MAG: RluA family pseudouridine synthase [Ruthenibacterium sp.]